METRYLFLLIIYCPSSSLQQSGEIFCPLDQFDCSQEGVHCTIVRDPECRLSNTPTKAVTGYPDPVSNLIVRPYYLKPEYPVPPNSISRVEISWELPRNENSQYLTGFEVRLAKGLSTPHCFVFNLSISDDVTRIHNEYFQFLLNCSKLHNGAYSVTVTSLPRAPFSEKVSSALLKIVQKYKDKNPEQCSRSLIEERKCWDTDIVVYNQECTRSLKVAFTQAPKSLAIEKYNIAVMEKDALRSDKTETAYSDYSKEFLETNVNMTDVLTLPLLDRSVFIIPTGSGCNECRTSQSGTFDIRQKNSSGKECTFNYPIQPTSEPDSIDQGFLIGIIAGSVIVAAVLTVAIVLVAFRTRKRRRRSASGYDNQGIDSRSLISTSSSKPLLSSSQPHDINYNPRHGSGKKVFLVYSNDSPMHQNVVGCFYTFLKSLDFDVIYDRMHSTNQQIRENKTAWIRQTMSSCDFILVINSEGTFHKGKVFQHGFHYPKFDCDTSCFGDMFIPSLQILSEDVRQERPMFIPKLVMSHFEYTSPDQICVPRDHLESLDNFKLMTSIDNLIRHMDQDISSADIADDVKIVQASNALINAICQKTSVVKRNADWFRQYNGVPVLRVPPPDIIQHTPTEETHDAQVAHTYMGTSLGNSNGATVSSLGDSMLVSMVPPVLPEDIKSEIDWQITDIINEDSGLGNSRSFSNV